MINEIKFVYEYTKKELQGSKENWWTNPCNIIQEKYKSTAFDFDTFIVIITIASFESRTEHFTIN